MEYAKIKTATKAEIEEVRKKVGFQVYFDTKIVPDMPDYYSGSDYVDFIAHNNKCKCPLQAENTASFSLKTYVDGVTTFKCFGCDKSGDIIKLHMYFMSSHRNINMSYTQAAKELYDEFILGKIVKTNVVNTKIKLKSDAPMELSTIVEKTKFQLYVNQTEKFMLNNKVDIEGKIRYYKLMDKMNYLVTNNLINASVAKKTLEDEYSRLNMSE